MAIISGRVDRVVERTTKFGPFYSIQLQGTYYGLGKSANGVSDGDNVEFIATQNEKGFWDIQKGSLKPIAAPVVSDKPQPATGETKSSYTDTRQDSIVYQSSRKDAIEFVTLLVEQGMIDFGKAKGADKQAIVETYLDKFTEHFVTEVQQNKPFLSQDTESEVSAQDSGTKQADFL